MAGFTANQQGIRELFASQGMGDAMVAIAERGKDFAESISPVRTGRYKTGFILLGPHNDPTGARRHRAGGDREPLPEGESGGGFHIERLTTPEGYAGARLFNDTPYARYLEFGTRYMRAQHILGRSLDAMRS